MNELTLDKDYRRGMRGQRVRWIQEWLTLNGIGLVPDGHFGPATDLAVRQFQERSGLKADGVVGKRTYTMLTAPMRFVIEPISPRGSLRQTVVAYAKRHLKKRPKEIGGQNMGPWVRLYMSGYEGADWPWCAGFASFILKQACETMDLDLPIQPSFSCDLLAASAKEHDRFLAGRGLDRGKIRAGMLFLSRRSEWDWSHVGIVVKPRTDVFMTIEGNTNWEGGREGYEVCQRIRGYRDKDFIVI